MFQRKRPTAPADEADDEREIKDEARAAIGKSRQQIDRARSILEKEVLRLDKILVRGK